MIPLVTVSHGTRLRSGNLVGPAVTARAARLLQVPGAAAYVDLCRPSLDEALAAGAGTGPSVVVPLLLSTGVHLDRDIPEVVHRSGRPAVIAPGLGPDPMLAEVVVRRLRGAGAGPGDPVVLVAAGSRQPGACVDLLRAAGLLAARWGGPVRAATLNGLGPSMEEACAAARRAAPGRRLAVAPYLLARGHFATQATRLARLHGATTVAEVIGADPLVARLVVRRYRQAVAALGTRSRAC